MPLNLAILLPLPEEGEDNDYLTLTKESSMLHSDLETTL